VALNHWYIRIIRLDNNYSGDLPAVHRETEKQYNSATIVTEVALDGEAVYDESATINYRDATAGSEPGMHA